MKNIAANEPQNRFGELPNSAQRKQARADLEIFFTSADARLAPDAKNLTDTDIQQLANALR